jgi:hypothetical protein
MDPNATLATMRDKTADPADRLDAANALLTWLGNGGFVPDGLVKVRGLGGNTAARFLAANTVRDEAAMILVDANGGDPS